MHSEIVRPELSQAFLRTGVSVFILKADAARLSRNLPVPGRKVVCYNRQDGQEDGRQVEEIDIVRFSAGLDWPPQRPHRPRILSETGGHRPLV